MYYPVPKDTQQVFAHVVPILHPFLCGRSWLFISAGGGLGLGLPQVRVTLANSFTEEQEFTKYELKMLSQVFLPLILHSFLSPSLSIGGHFSYIS